MMTIYGDKVVIGISIIATLVCIRELRKDL